MREGGGGLQAGGRRDDIEILKKEEHSFELDGHGGVKQSTREQAGVLWAFTERMYLLP